MISAALTRLWRQIIVLALVNLKTSILIQKFHPYTGNLKSIRSGDQHAAETLKCMSQLGLAAVLSGCRCSTLLTGCLTEMHRAAHN